MSNQQQQQQQQPPFNTTNTQSFQNHPPLPIKPQTKKETRRLQANQLLEQQASLYPPIAPSNNYHPAKNDNSGLSLGAPPSIEVYNKVRDDLKKKNDDEKLLNEQVKLGLIAAPVPPPPPVPPVVQPAAGASSPVKDFKVDVTKENTKAEADVVFVDVPVRNNGIAGGVQGQAQAQVQQHQQQGQAQQQQQMNSKPPHSNNANATVGAAPQQQQQQQQQMRQSSQQNANGNGNASAANSKSIQGASNLRSSNRDVVYVNDDEEEDEEAEEETEVSKPAQATKPGVNTRNKKQVDYTSDGSDGSYDSSDDKIQARGNGNNNNQNNNNQNNNQNNNNNAYNNDHQHQNNYQNNYNNNNINNNNDYNNNNDNNYYNYDSDNTDSSDTELVPEKGVPSPGEKIAINCPADPPHPAGWYSALVVSVEEYRNELTPTKKSNRKADSRTSSKAVAPKSNDSLVPPVEFMLTLEWDGGDLDTLDTPEWRKLGEEPDSKGSRKDTRLRPHVAIIVRRLVCIERVEGRMPLGTRSGRRGHRDNQNSNSYGANGEYNSLQSYRISEQSLYNSNSHPVLPTLPPQEWIRCNSPSCGKWRALPSFLTSAMVTKSIGKCIFKNNNVYGASNHDNGNSSRFAFDDNHRNGDDGGDIRTRGSTSSSSNKGGLVSPSMYTSLKSVAATNTSGGINMDNNFYCVLNFWDESKASCNAGQETRLMEVWEDGYVRNRGEEEEKGRGKRENKRRR